jgi:hypothetical protein
VSPRSVEVKVILHNYYCTVRVTSVSCFCTVLLTAVEMLTESTKTNQNSHISRNIKEKDVQMKENHQIIEYMVVGDDEDCEDCIETTDLTSAQELTARNVNPMKLVTMLRVRFGIGRYEISVSQPAYSEKNELILHRESATYIIFGPRDVFRCRR